MLYKLVTTEPQPNPSAHSFSLDLTIKAQLLTVYQRPILKKVRLTRPYHIRPLRGRKMTTPAYHLSDPIPQPTHPSPSIRITVKRWNGWNRETGGATAAQPGHQAPSLGDATWERLVARHVSTKFRARAFVFQRNQLHTSIILTQSVPIKL